MLLGKTIRIVPAFDDRASRRFADGNWQDPRPEFCPGDVDPNQIDCGENRNIMVSGEIGQGYALKVAK